MVDIGARRKHVTFYRIERHPDGAGGYETKDIRIARLWAQVMPKGGGEREAGGGTEFYQTFEIIARYHPDVTTASVVVWAGRRMNIRAVANIDERRRYMTVTAEEGVAD